MARNKVTGIGQYNAFCQSCGRKYKAHELRKRPEDGLMVCPDDWEPIHPQKYIKFKRDSKPLPFVLSQDGSATDPSAGSLTDIGGNTFPPSVNMNAISEVIISGEAINNATVGFTVYKAVIDTPVTLPSGITLTVATGGYLRVKQADGSYKTLGAGSFTGASSGWGGDYTLAVVTTGTNTYGVTTSLGSVSPSTYADTGEPFNQITSDTDDMDVTLVISGLYLQSEFTTVTFYDNSGTAIVAFASGDATTYEQLDTSTQWTWAGVATVPFEAEGTYYMTFS